MLDTIVLTLKQSEFEMKEMDAFSPSARGLYQPPYFTLGKRGYVACVQNPTKGELEQGIYKPRLTLTKRKARGGYDISLRIEFSIPKLAHGNNFHELEDRDFGRVLDRLHVTLSGMGICVKRECLRQARVSAIHFSKNIRLADYTTCSMVLGELGKADLTRRLDCNKTDYRNEGAAIRAHTSSYEIVFYDKVRDMQQALRISEKRGLEKDYAVQRDLFAVLPKQWEVLRMEVRLGKPAKLQSLLDELSITVELTFQALFSAAISRAVLLHYWYKATEDVPLLALSGFAPDELFQALMKESRNTAKPAKVLQRIGLLALAHTVGLRGTKVLVTQHADARTWQRMKKDMNGLDVSAKMKYAATREVGRCLETFEALQMGEISDKKMAGGGYDKAQKPRTQHSKRSMKQKG